MLIWLCLLVGGYSMIGCCNGRQLGVLEGVHIPFEKSILLLSTGLNDNTTTPILSSRNNTITTNTTESILFYLNGAGVRSFSLLFHGWGDIKIYVAKLYTTSSIPLTTTESIYAACISYNGSSSSRTSHHLVFEFTFLRHVNQHRVTDAWKHQLHHSIEHNYTLYSQYHNDSYTFIHSFGPIQKGGTITVQLLSDGRTVIYDQEFIYKNTIVGRQFQEAFLSMWFGTKPVTVELKRNLLGYHNFTDQMGNLPLLNKTSNVQHERNQQSNQYEHVVSMDGQID